MVGRYQSYPEYVSSDVAHIKTIPVGWSVKRLKFVSRLNPSKSGLSEFPKELEVSFVPMEAVGLGDVVDASRTKKLGDVLSGYTYISENDVLIAKITPCFENGKGGLARELKNGIGFATTEVIPIRVTKSALNADFLNYMVACDPFRKLAEGSMYGAGGQKRVPDEFVANYKHALPPLEEQKAIARFLDHETAKIDELIAKQGRLIELLKEKRQAVISHAVTKGLNPDAPMKDSGVEWLGEVPEHLKVSRIKQVMTFLTSGPRGWSEHFSEESGDYFLQSGDLTDEMTISFEDAQRCEPPVNAEGVRTMLNPLDVLVCITGAKTGRVAVASELPGRVYINQHLALIRPVQSLIASKYLGYMLYSKIGREFFSVTQYGLKEGLSLSNVGEAPVCMPPLKEQISITEYLDEQISKYEVLSASSAKAVDLLKERRTALISAAVTGKIDVRNWKPDDSQ